MMSRMEGRCAGNVPFLFIPLLQRLQMTMTYFPHYRDGSLVNLMSSLLQASDGQSPYAPFALLPPDEIKRVTHLVLLVQEAQVGQHAGHLLHRGLLGELEDPVLAVERVLARPVGLQVIVQKEWQGEQTAEGDAEGHGEGEHGARADPPAGAGTGVGRASTHRGTPGRWPPAAG